MFRISPAIIIVSLTCTNAALADITATEAWESWHKQMIASGYEVSFDLENSGDILTVNDLILSKDMHAGPEKTVITLGAVSYIDRSDGTVEMVFGTDSTFSWQAESGTYMKFDRKHTNMRYILSGTVDALKHSFTADEITFSLTEMKLNEQTVKDAKISLKAANISSQFQLSGEALKIGDMSFSLSKLDYDIKVEVPEPVYGNMDWSGVVTGLSAVLNFAVPENMENNSFPETMDAGFSLESSFSFDQIKTKSRFVDNKKNGEFSLVSNGGGFSLNMTPEVNDLINMQTKISLLDLDFGMDISGPDQEPGTSVELSANDVGLDLSLLLPENMDMEIPYKSFNDGLDIQYSHKIGDYSAIFKTTDYGQTTTVNSKVKSANIALSANREEFLLKGQSLGAETVVETDVMPGPVGYSFGEASIDLQLPMAVSAKPEAFKLNLILSDVLISKTLWAFFDKQSLLSHDAASLTLNLSGFGNWLVDIMDPATEDTDKKGEIHSLNLKTLAIMAAGAKLTGNADFSFNNDDLDTFAGMPAPTGKAHFNISGANALIESLLKLDIMSPEDAMGARMGLNLVAIVGDQDDTLVSDIAITADGGITANGKRLK